MLNKLLHEFSYNDGGYDAAIEEQRKILPDQMAYVESLSKRNKHLLNVYTYKGDRFVNSLLRAGEGDDIRDAYLEIFGNSPILQTPLVLYRYNSHDDQGSVYRDLGIMSTTLSQESLLFQIKPTPCCVYIITVPAGMQVLPISEVSAFPDENEVLLPPGTTLIIIDEGIYVDEAKYDHGIETTYIKAYWCTVVHSPIKKRKREEDDEDTHRPVKKFKKNAE